MSFCTFTTDDTSYNPRAHFSSSLSDPTALSSASLFASHISYDEDEPILSRPATTFTQRPLRSRPSVWQIAAPSSALPDKESSDASSDSTFAALPNLMTRASDMFGNLRAASSPSSSPERGRPRASVQERFAELLQSVSPSPVPASTLPNFGTETSAFYPSSFSAAFPSSVPSSQPTKNTRRESTFQSAAKFINQGLTGLMGVSMPPKSPSPFSIREADEEDEDLLLHLDVRRALLPTHPPSTYGEKAYTDLLANAEALVTRMRNAYVASQTSSSPAAITSIQRSATSRPRAAATRHNHHRDEEELDEARLRATSLHTRLDQFHVSAPYARSESVSSSSSCDNCICGEDQEGSVFDSADGMSSASSLDDEEVMEDIDLGGRLSDLNELNLQEQNRRLKARVAQLEEALEGCLGLVNGEVGLV